MTQRPKSPGVAYATVALALIMMLAVLALTQRQPPPPSIAEFAPQAIARISDPSTDSSVGRAAQAGPRHEPGTSIAGATPSPVDVPRVRKCIGDPPRQIEDPQSPPCVPYWAGDNGGATYKGVTRDEVRVFAPIPGMSDADSTMRDAMNAMAAFFNKRFEFYGRRLNVIVAAPLSPQDDANSRTFQQAFAVRADEEEHAFAGTFYQSSAGLYYHAEMARRRLVSAGGNPEFVLNQQLLASQAPYRWSYPMSVDKMFAGAGDWVCSRLAGRPAAHAGDPLMQQTTRVFGLMHLNYAGHATKAEWPDASQAVSRMQACGAKPVAIADQNFDDGDYQGHQNLILKFKTAGVTSVLCLCIVLTFLRLFTAATDQGFFPEWLGTSYGDIDANLWMKVFGGDSNKSQVSHLFGVTYVPRQIRPAREPWVEAINEVNPDLARSPANQDVAHGWESREFYHSLLLIASGIQLAGPHLTPQSFAKGLHAARFPNPQDERHPGKAGFDGGSYSMTQDGAEWWWEPTAPSPYPGDSAGTPCYVDAGRRWPIDGWPTSPGPFFSGTCDGGAS